MEAIHLPTYHATRLYIPEDGILVTAVKTTEMEG
jgi:hypothetical protein